jgi:iron complex transport system permease protein
MRVAPARVAPAPEPPVKRPEGRLLDDRGPPEAALPATRLRAGQVISGLLFLAVAALASVLAGPADLPPLRVLEELVAKIPFLHLHAGLGATGSVVVWQLRMPRTVLGGLVGAMLATAGASYQGVFSNPLADPYLLGVASGAGLGATVAVAYWGAGSGTGWPGTLPAAAFAGAVVAVAATFALGRSRDLGRSPATLVLAGVAVAAFFTAAQTFLLARQSPGDLTLVYTWILGSLSTAGWSQVELVLPYIGAAALALFAFRRVLDVLSVGDEEATALGVRASSARLAVVAAATLGTAAAVSVSGLIGFVGIIVPHTVRLLAGPSYRRIIPLSLLFGAGFLVLADLLARTVLSPQELPLGVVTAFLGAPFFLVVLRQAKRMA